MRPPGPDSTAQQVLTVYESPESPGWYRVSLVMDREGDRFENVYGFRVE